jgi:type II secretory pathway component PulF
LRLPVVGSFAHKLALSRFSKHFALLFGSGTDLLRLLGLLKKVVGNAVLEKELELIHQRVTTGESLAASFAESPWFPPMIQRLISVGEKAGQLDNTLLKAAEYLDKEIPRALKQAFTLLEAIIIAILGGLIAISALSILLPILQLRNQLV